MDRSRMVRVEVGIKRDPKTKMLTSETKVKVDGTFAKIYRDWPAGKESLIAARVWRSAIKDQYRRKHPTLKLRSNGTWLVRLPATNKYQSLERDFGYSFGEANEWARSSFEDRAKGKWTDGTHTIESVWGCFLSHTNSLPSEATLLRYIQIWERDLKSYWAPEVVSDIGAKRVQRWIDEWSGPITKLEKAHSVLKVILSHAVDEDLIPYNPAFKRKLPDRPRPKSPAIPPEKLKKLLNHPKRESDKLALTLAIQSGLRFSEWSALRVRDFSLEACTVTVAQHQSRRLDGRVEITDGHKTSKHSKTAGITMELAERIRAMIEIAGLGLDDLLFPAPKGGAWPYPNFRKRVWEPARIASGIDCVPYMTGTHSTKRSTVTVAYEAGLSLATIRGQTKHSGTRIIQDVYLQTSEGSEREVADTVQQTVGLPE